MASGNMTAGHSSARQLVIICGMSGAGRSGAANHFDDLGYFVIDNLPVRLIEKVIELAGGQSGDFSRLAFVVGSGGNGAKAVMGGPSRQAAEVIAGLKSRSGFQTRVLFLEASTPVLVQRYGSTRRPHPFVLAGRIALEGQSVAAGSVAASVSAAATVANPAAAGASTSDMGLEKAIEAEREALRELKVLADVVIDTSSLNIHQLQVRIADAFGFDSDGKAMQVRLVSFGYKYGLPADADTVMDCRFMANPHWEAELRDFTGLDSQVRDFVLASAAEFVGQQVEMYLGLLPEYAQQGRSYVTLAFGCTGGRHRSVCVAEEIAERLRLKGFAVSVEHRDLTSGN